MLEALRRSTGGILAKILIGLLVISFAVWGIADVFTGRTDTTIATVGDSDIQPEEFEQAYQTEINKFSRQTGQRLSADQARSLGLDQQVLKQMIGATAIEEHAQQLDLKLSNQAILDGLAKDPDYQDQNGKFSPIALQNLLNQAGLSEQFFFRQRRKDELREQIVNALISATAVPAPMVDILNDWRNEKRILEYITIDVDRVVKLPKPTDKDLKDTFEQNKAKFMVPELRKVAILVLSGEELTKKANIAEADIKASYDQTKETYNVQERRRIQQIPFEDKAKADGAKKALESGKSFVDVAKEAGATESDIDLGTIEKKSLIDPKIADAAFNLKVGDISEVIEGRFTTVLLRVTEITPADIKTFDDVKQQVRERLAQEQASLEIQRLYDEVDDGRAGGRPLKEIASSLDLKFIDVAAVSAGNKDTTGKKVLDSPDGPTMVADAFEAEIGIEREPVQLSDGGYAWIDLLAVTPTKQKAFEEVKADVEKLWGDNKRTQMLSEIAANSVKRIQEGENFTRIAVEMGGPVNSSPELTRATVPQGLTLAAVSQAFLLPLNGATSTTTSNGKSRIIVRVKEIKQAEKLTDATRKNIIQELQRQRQSDGLDEYVLALRDRLGVTINTAQFERTTGASTQP